MAWLVVGLRDPSAKLLRVRNSRGQEDEAYFMWQQDDALFPYDASVLVSVRLRKGVEVNEQSSSKGGFAFGGKHTVLWLAGTSCWTLCTGSENTQTVCE